MESQKTILIVDDEEDLRETVEFQFKANGFNVVTAVDGVDGLEKLETVKPDLIVLDVNMPRMNGLEFYERIKGKDEKPKYPVLILTARANMEQLFKDLDVDGFMSKPFELDALVKEGEVIIKRNSGMIRREKGSTELRARKICIVENDSEISQKFAIEFLEAGYIVNSAQSGASAIKRLTMDAPDVAIISLGLSDISGDVVIGKLKGIEETKEIKYLLYIAKSGEKAQVTKKISEKEGIAKFIEFRNSKDLLDAVDSLF